MKPVRTCVGCRSRDDKSSLVRVIALDGVLDIDRLASADGRGSWVHPTQQCVSQALARKAFGRALRTNVINTEALNAFLAD